MKKWQCIVCGLIYNEADGWPDDGIAPGTLWQDVPEDWLCPDCGVVLAEAEPGHHHDKIDPRWAKLAELAGPPANDDGDR